LAQVSEALPDTLDGFSIVPTLLSVEGQQQHEFLYWEDAEYLREKPFGPIPETFMQAVRIGNWKGLKNSPDSAFVLYNLESDPAERQDLASDYPQLSEKIKHIMEQSHLPAPAQVDMTQKEAARLYIPRK
jgi:arylsulfatase A-like enzyme